MTAIPVLGMDAETERKDALQRLSLRLEHHGHELIGRMQLLGLGPLIQYFGKDWDHLRERVHESVRSILRSYSDQFIVSCPFDDDPTSYSLPEAARKRRPIAVPRSANAFSTNFWVRKPTPV